MISLSGYTFLGAVYEDERIRVVHAYSQPDKVRMLPLLGGYIRFENVSFQYYTGEPTSGTIYADGYPLSSADRIVVLDQGAIAEAGTHEELLQRKGLYHYLVQQQTM